MRQNSRGKTKSEVGFEIGSVGSEVEEKSEGYAIVLFEKNQGGDAMLVDVRDEDAEEYANVTFQNV